MDFNQVVQSRRSVKSFNNADVSEDKLNSILNAVTTAPSWKNHQCWKMVIVKNNNIKKQISDALGSGNPAKNAVHEAPLLAVICAEPHHSNIIDEKYYYLVDSAIAMDHFILAASNEGLGTCWVADFDEDKIKHSLQIPEKYKVVALTPVGYPSQTPDTESKPQVQDIAYMEQWGNYLH